MPAASEFMSKIYMVSGKGGVGKSTIAASLGHLFASRGHKTLLVELGNNSYFNYIYLKKFGIEGQNVAPNLDVAVWSGESCLKEFIGYYIRLSAVVDLFLKIK